MADETLVKTITDYLSVPKRSIAARVGVILVGTLLGAGISLLITYFAFPAAITATALAFGISGAAAMGLSLTLVGMIGALFGTGLLAFLEAIVVKNADSNSQFMQRLMVFCFLTGGASMAAFITIATPSVFLAFTTTTGGTAPLYFIGSVLMSMVIFGLVSYGLYRLVEKAAPQTNQNKVEVKSKKPPVKAEKSDTKQNNAAPEKKAVDLASPPVQISESKIEKNDLKKTDSTPTTLSLDQKKPNFEEKLKETAIPTDSAPLSAASLILPVAPPILVPVKSEKKTDLDKKIAQLKYILKDHVIEALNSADSFYAAMDEIHKQFEALQDEEAKWRAFLPELEALFNAYQILYSNTDPHPSVANILYDIGCAYLMMQPSQPLKAKDAFERTLTIEEKYYKKDCLEIGRTLCVLGHTYSILGNSQTQKAVLNRALGIFKKYLGENSMSVLHVLTNLSSAHGVLGDVQKQKELLLLALDTIDQYYGPDNEERAIILNNLGYVENILGKPEKAKKLLQKALSIYNRLHGKGYVLSGNTLGNLGYSYQALGDAKQGKIFLEQGLAINEKHYGKEHIGLFLTLGWLGNTCSALKLYRESAGYYERAKRLLEGEQGKGYEETHEWRKLQKIWCANLEKMKILVKEEETEGLSMSHP